MSPITKFGLLSFASTAIAAPWSVPAGHSHGGHRHHTHGSGTGYPTGTGGPYPAGNGTGPYGSGTGTVASTGYVYYTGFTTVTNIVTVGAGSLSTSSSCSTPTVSTTTTHVLTSTIIPSASTAAAAVATSASVQAAGFSYGDFSFPWSHHSSSASSTSTPPPPPVPTTSSASSTPVAPVETSTTSTSSTPVAPVETSTTSTTPTSTAVPTTYSAPAVVTTSSSIAAVETTSSTSAAPTPSSTYGASSSGTKRGLPYNNADLTTCFAGSQVSWAYNWASSSSGLNTDSFEYVPQLWGNTDSFTSGWEAAAKSAIASGSKHLLAFNEPDLDTQSNIDPSDAAASYQTYMSDLFGGSDIQLGSPAVTNGGGSMGLTWLSSFLDACSDCQVDFVAIHWYDSYTNFAYLQQHVQQAHEQTGKPVWITEFGTTDGDDEQIAGFLEQALPWLDSQSYVQRYAYFMASDGLLNSGTEMSTYGQTFATYES